MNSTLKMILSGLIIWVVRLVAALPFLDSEQRLSVTLTSDGRLPENVEIFFSVLILALVAATIVCTIWLFQQVDGTGTAYGLKAGLIMLAVVSVIDLILAVGLGSRTLGGWFINQFLDLSPVLLIPLAIGFVLDRAKG